MDDLGALLDSVAASDRGLTVVSDVGVEQLRWSTFFEQALQVRDELTALGIVAGDSVAVAGPSCTATLKLILACLLNAVGVSVLPPLRAQPTWQKRISILNPALVCVHAGYYDQTARRLSAVRYDDDGLAKDGHRLEPHGASPDSGVRIVQFSSGSTGSPRGVQVRQGNLAANLVAMARRLALGSADTMVSWLPLYHDMGLIGTYLLPMTHGSNLILIDTNLYRHNPIVWLQWLDGVQRAITVAPHTAYAAAARALRSSLPVDLSGLRLALNGSEPINVGEFRSFMEFGASRGLRSTAAYCVYGLAEATLAVTFPEEADGLLTCAGPTNGPTEARSEELQEHAQVGAPLSGVRVRVVGNADEEVPDGVSGEIQVQGPSVCESYLDGDGHEVPMNLIDGWLPTGDIGFRVDRDIVICGRKKDVVVVGGRSICAEEIEAAAASVSGLANGRLAAFSVPRSNGREVVVLMIETNSPSDTLALEARSAIRNRVGIRIGDVIFMPQRSLPRTTSGKVRRAECRTRLLDSTCSA